MPQAIYLICVVYKAGIFSLRLFESFTVIIFYSPGNKIFIRLKLWCFKKKKKKQTKKKKKLDGTNRLYREGEKLLQNCRKVFFFKLWSKSHIPINAIRGKTIDLGEK